MAGRCECAPDWGGRDCSVPQCLGNCSRHGACLNGTCWCRPGYGGIDCAVRTCPSSCSGNGWCRDGECLCYPEFGGPECAEHAAPTAQLPVRCALGCARDCLARCHSAAEANCYRGCTSACLPKCATSANPDVEALAAAAEAHVSRVAAHTSIAVEDDAELETAVLPIA